MEQYMKILKSYKRMPIELERKYRENVKLLEVRKSDILQKIGTISDHIYFIEKGVIRGFGYKERKQQTYWLRKENDFILSLKKLFPEPLEIPICIEALEDSILWDFPASLVNELENEFAAFNTQFMTMMLKDMEKRKSEFRALQKNSPAEMYNYVRQHAPGLIGRVPAKYLASYMNTTVSVFNHLHKSHISLNLSSKRRVRGKER